MDPIVKLRAKFEETVDSLNELNAKGNKSAEEVEKVRELLAAAKQLKVDIESAKEAEELKAWGSKVESPMPVLAAGAPAADPTKDQGWKNAGEFFMAVKAAATPGNQIDKRLITGIKAASGLSESVPSDGGFLVQTDFATELLKRANDTGVLAPRARRIPISGNANGIKLNGIDETSRVNGSRWGGVQSYWEGEADTATASKPKFRQMELTLKKLFGLCYATEEILQDASALESVMMQAFAEEFGFKVDDAIMNGTGAGQPLGIMNSSALVSVAKEVGQTAATIVPENLVKMYARMWARSRQNAVWYINQDIEPQLFTLGIQVGTGGGTVYMPPGGLSGQPYGTLFGRPVIAIEQAQTLGTQGDIMFADLSQYLLVDKGSVQPSVSIHVRFIYDESTFKFTYRVDGQPIWNSALTPFKGSNTQSPFVTLDARA